jgi:molybdopterin-guanine dinucleotide biosynthesis protein A
MTVPAPRFDAVVLAGGESRRMGGQDKTRLVVGGAPLLDRVLASVEAAVTRVVVGEQRPTEVAVRWTREQPAGSGPAAAVRAGLALVSQPVVVLLAGDLPFVNAHVVSRIVTAVGTGDGVVLTDENGRPQWLCSAWRLDRLRDAELVAGGSLHGPLSRLDVARLDQRDALDGTRALPPAFDCDTPEEYRLAEELHRERARRVHRDDLASPGARRGGGRP